ncbi:hypothetical protein POM88_047654 [Heracleum sosnowskyi]|uniref:MATH domain-containing protein n=1 Tax=Heracleum sosnowskyi TaxID=360622 RepID=A0AAD8GTW0_9APIA|nr:hypothetical protein POM88_047654 [Heracleum sosnowskyi]
MVSTAEDDEGVLREIRDTPPAHYVLKIQSFSLYSENGVRQIKSNSFQVGEHQWKIILFPKGKNGGKDDHVSIYLMLDSMSSLSAGKGVNAFFKFFLLDQIRGKYLAVQGRPRVDCDSDEFVVGGYKWKLSLHPEGNKKHRGFSLSLYLVIIYRIKVPSGLVRQNQTGVGLPSSN